jgi:hypothetical protein
MKLVREPLFHFLVAGVVLFGGHALLNRNADDSQPNRPTPVRIGQGEVHWLTETFTLQRQRAPTPEELRSLVAEFLNEELLAREARDMKLDENDTVIRRRLAQKMTFLVEGTSRRAEPTDAELQQLYEANPERFRTDARVSFKHVYFNPANRADPASDAENMLADLSGAVGEGAGVVGDRFLLGSEFHEEDERSVSGTLGQQFAQELFLLKPGNWSGPITSGFGVHLVRVDALEGSRVRPFADMRRELVDEWRRDQEQNAKERYFARIQKKYDVVIDESVQQLIAPVAKTARAAQ